MSNSNFEGVLRKLYDLEGVVLIALYGSFARQEVDRRSDIDLLMLFTTKQTKEQALAKIDDITAKYADRLIQITARSLDEIDESDTYFLRNIMRDAKILYFRRMLPLDIDLFTVPLHTILDLTPYILIKFDLSNLSDAKEKRRFNTALYGHISKKKRGRKTYKYRYHGLLEQVGGEKIGPGVILIPEESLKRVEELLDEYGIDADVEKIWR